MRRNAFVTTHSDSDTRHARQGVVRPALEIAATLPCQRATTGGAKRFRGAIARQIRQDIWRALAGLRGLSPIVTVSQDQTQKPQVSIVVGIQTNGARLPLQHVRSQIEAVLSDPNHQQRWFRYAEKRAKC